jgi:hypothetical protein
VDNFKKGKRSSTWDSGDKEDNATWDNFQLKCRGSLSFLKKECHDILLKILFCMNENVPCNL